MADNATTTSGPPGRLRASDADRDRVAHVLSDALIEGRLTQEEHADRIDATYSAKTVGELGALIDDLPDGGFSGAPELSVLRIGPAGACPSDRALLDTGTGTESIVAVLGVAERRKRWLMEPRTNASAAFGSIELDLREAVLAQRDVTVQCALLCSGMRLVIPRGVRITVDSSMVACSMDLATYTEPSDNYAPTVHLTGVSVMSGLEVRTHST